MSLLILTFIAVFVWLLLLDRSKKSFIYNDFGVGIPESYSILGIDVSHHQGKINWMQLDSMQVDNDSIHFAYIKSSEGLNFEDPRFVENASGALNAGIPFGLYHFFRVELSARKQALFFAEKCISVNDTLRPMIDVEISNGFGKQRLIDSVFVFLETFEKKLKMRPIIYTYESFYEDYFKNSYLKNDLFWIANYNGYCKAIKQENVLIWQFSESGTVNGVSTKVDLNVAKPDFVNLMYQD